MQILLKILMRRIARIWSPGVILTLDEDGLQDSVSISDTAHDRKVVGVYTGAGLYKPRLILENLLMKKEEFQ
jgi:hypothetical protein